MARTDDDSWDPASGVGATATMVAAGRAMATKDPRRLINDPFAEPRFWGEAGQVAVDKIESLARRYRHTHFAIAKWDTSLRPFVEIVEKALHGLDRTAPFDLICFPADSADRFIDERGEIHLHHEDVEWLRLT